MSSIRSFALVCVAGLALGRGAAAPAQQSKPATRSSEPFHFVISEVQGMVQMRQSANDPWQPARVGTELREGAEFRTGIRSLVRFRLPPDQEVTLDRLGTVKILRADIEGKTALTDLGMKYGRVQYDVEQAGLQHDATIRSPGATLAVGGTERMGLYNQGFYPTQAYAMQPTVLHNAQGRRVRFGQTGGPEASVSGNQTSAAEEKLSNSVIDPNSRFVGLTSAETAPIYKGFLRFAKPQDIQFSVLGRLLNQNSTGSTVGTLPIGKQLRILMIWAGLPGGDVDLSVVSPKGEVVSRSHPVVASSGHYLGNGVANGKGVGAEQIVFERSFIPGNYTIQEKLNTSGTANVQVFVIRDPLGEGASVSHLHDTLTSRRPTASHIVNVGAGPQNSGRSRR